MAAELLLKFTFTTAAVWLVLQLAQRCGDRIAGLAAGLPITSLPTLTVLGLDHGDTFVVQAAIGGLLAVASSAVFAVVYVRLAAGSLRCARTISLLCALAAAGAVSFGLYAGQDAGWIGAWWACAVAALACLGAAAMVPTPAATRFASQCDGTPHLLVAVLVGGITALVTSLTSALPPAACGLIAGLPTVCIVVLMRQHGLHGHVGAARMLHGYVRGLGMRVAFMALAACAGETGWGWAVALGVLCACALGLLTRRTVVVDATPPVFGDPKAVPAAVDEASRSPRRTLDAETSRVPTILRDSIDGLQGRGPPPEVASEVHAVHGKDLPESGPVTAETVHPVIAGRLPMMGLDAGATLSLGTRTMPSALTGSMPTPAAVCTSACLTPVVQQVVARAGEHRSQGRGEMSKATVLRGAMRLDMSADESRRPVARAPARQESRR